MAAQGKLLGWIGWGISALLTFALGASACMKFALPEWMLKDWVDKFDYPASLARLIGVVELICLVLFLIPRTSILGGVLLTGYLGGAIATHVRINDNFAGGIIMGLLVWLALFLREPRVRALLPLTSAAPSEATGR